MYRPLLILIPFSHVCTCVCLPWPRRLGATGLSVPSYLVMQGFLAAIVFGVVEGLWQYMKLMKFLKVSCFLIRTYHFETCTATVRIHDPIFAHWAIMGYIILGYLEPESRSCLSALEAVVTSYLSDSLDLGRWCPPAHGCETDREVRKVRIFNQDLDIYIYIAYIYVCQVNAYKRPCGWVIKKFGSAILVQVPLIGIFFFDPWRNPWQQKPQLQLWRGHGSLAMKSVFKQETNKQPLNLHHTYGFHLLTCNDKLCENYLYIPWSEKSLYLRWKWQGTWWLGTA